MEGKYKAKGNSLNAPQKARKLRGTFFNAAVLPERSLSDREMGWRDNWLGWPGVCLHETMSATPAKPIPAPRVKETLQRLKTNIGKIIRGKDAVIDQVLIAVV